MLNRINSFPHKWPGSYHPGHFIYTPTRYSGMENLLERSLDFIKQIRDYVSNVVFYGADWDNLLPVVFNQNDRRELHYDEQKSFEEVPILGKRNIK